MFAFIAAPPAPTLLAANGSALVAPSRAPPHGQDMLVFGFAARQRAEQFRKRFDGGEFLGPKDRPNWPGARQANMHLATDTRESVALAGHSGSS